MLNVTCSFKTKQLILEYKSKRLPLETKNTLQLESGNLGFIEAFRKQ